MFKAVKKKSKINFIMKRKKKVGSINFTPWETTKCFAMIRKASINFCDSLEVKIDMKLDERVYESGTVE